MNDSNPESVLNQINELTRQFRKHIANGDAPQIERFLPRVTNRGKETLFSNLLDIEVSFRRSKGETPTSDEYLNTLPRIRSLSKASVF